MGPLGVEHVGEIGFVCRLVWCWTPSHTRSPRARSPAAPRCCRSQEAGDPGIVTADDIKGIMQMQGSQGNRRRAIAWRSTPGRAIAGATTAYKSMNGRSAEGGARPLQRGEPGFGISACEYMASRDIALTMCDTSACDAQPSGEQGPDFAVPCHTEMQTRRGYLEPGKRRHEVPCRQESSRGRVHLGAAPDDRRHPGRLPILS